ncbi:Ulp1 protease family, C-terminal catalytic domain [Bradyrhizobium brasilense]|uniref:Ulp1 protease family, C-terminal catalytic domain n=1 Tax=Bradyrhizobium brasilense TaxID=1419277 RepID=A0A1G7F0E1_9BRAD|nr:Ulp1 family isopeptidase [Bradyrhizobium brasilense]SDE69362.1 Ulp1 protease family, C-terminal catalytic domain [Bradyrhizobium brasilense]
MEANYSDPNYWSNWYAEQHELLRARQESDDAPADQAGFEQQLSHLQLSSSEESSAEPSSPDTRPAEVHGSIQRIGLGGSMRMVPQSDPQDNRFSSTRRSVDIPRAHFGAAVPGSPSDLGAGAFGKVRDAASSESNPAARAKDSKGRGLLSRVKSRLGKVFGGSRGEKPLGDIASDAVTSELRIYAYKRTRASEEDAALISEFARAAVGSYASSTVQRMVEQLSRLSEFLNPRNLTLAGLVEDPDQLNVHVDEFVKAGGIKRVRAALEALRKFRAGELLPRPPAPPPPPSCTGDALLIHQFAAAARAHEVPDETIRPHTEVLKAFAEWLTANQKASLTSRFRSDEIAEDMMAYCEENDPKGRLFTALNHLRRLQPDGAGFETLGPGPRVMGRRTLSAYESDADLIDEATNEALRRLGPAATPKERKPIIAMASNRRKLSEWLKREGKDSIASRLNGNEQQKKQLEKDISEFKRAIGQPDIGLGINKLRQHPGGELRQHPGGEPRPGLHPYDDDADIIDGLVEEEQSKLGSRPAPKTIRNTASAQRRFSDWLRTTGRESFASRINGDWYQRRSLDEDYQEFTKANGNIGIGFKRLAQYVQVVEANRALGVAFPRQSTREPQLAEANSSWSPGAPSDFDPSERSAPERAPARSSDIYRGLDSLVDLSSMPHEARDDAQSAPVFRAAARPPLFAGQSGSPARSSDIYRGLDSFVDLPLTPQAVRDDALSAPAGSAAARPRLSIGQSGAPARSSDIYRGLESFVDLPSTPQEVRDDAQSAPAGRAAARPPLFSAQSGAPARSSNIYRGLESFVDLPSTPQSVRDDARSVLTARTAARPRPFAGQSGAPARSPDIYGGLESFVDLPSTPQETRDEAQSAPVLSPAGRPPFVIGPSGEPRQLEDIGYLVGQNWQHGSQPVADFLLDVLDNRMLLPSPYVVAQPIAIHGEMYSIRLGAAGRREAQFIHHPRPSSASDARVGAPATSASSGDRSGRVLGAREWLGDEHIQRDYELLAQQLRGSNPDLAARTRFVDPLIAFQVGQGTNVDALRAFHRTVNDRNGNDTADFLFLPVNDASATDLNRRGSHWSFLLVDRRDRDRPVAYHYDSTPRYNDRPAAMLAERVGANLQDAPISQQRNEYDCGVFVVDGTRALVSRLAAGPQPDLNLKNLVVDRQALQNRLRG